MATIPNAKRVKSTPADAPSARASSKPATNGARKRGAKATDDAARKPNGAPRKRGAAGSVNASDTSSDAGSTSAKSAKPKKASASKTKSKSAAAPAAAPAKSAKANAKRGAKGKAKAGKSASAAAPAVAPATAKGGKTKGKSAAKGKGAAKSASAPAAASASAPKKGRFGRPLPTEAAAAPAKGGGKAKASTKSSAKAAAPAAAPAKAKAKGGKGKSAAPSKAAPAKSSAKPAKSAGKTASHAESKGASSGKNGKSAKSRSSATDLSSYNQPAPSSAKPKSPRKSKDSGSSIAEASKQYTEAGYGGDSPAPKAAKKRARPGVGAIANLAKAYTGDADNSADDGDSGDETGGDADDEDASTRARRGAATGRTHAKPSTADATRAGLPKPGAAAPAFSLIGDDGETWSLASLSGRRFVLYFYPRDDTPGCTKEACDFRDRFASLRSADVQVLGVSSDSLASHAKFRAKYDLNFPLLSDPDRAVASAYGVVGEKTLYGRTSIGVIRSTFVVGPDGRIEHVISPVRVDGHAARIAELTAVSH